MMRSRSSCLGRIAVLAAPIFGSFADSGADADLPMGLREHIAVDNNAFTSVHEQLWNGMDYSSFDTLFNIELGRMMEEQAEQPGRHVEHEHEASVHVLGLQNTGTNLLQSMLLMNFGYRFHYYDLTWDRSLSEMGPLRHGIWKHSNLAEKMEVEPEVFDRMRAADVVPLIMVRDGLSWMQSMRKAPYELKDCVAGKKWYAKKCYHKVPGGYESRVRGKAYSSLEEIWNQWTQADDATSTDKRCFGKGVVIRYEDLVLRPTVVMDRIAAYLGVQKPAEWKIQTEAAKLHGNATGRVEAMGKISHKTFLAEYTDDEMTMVCDLLNTTKMYKHGYTDCADEARKLKANKRHSKHRLRAHDKRQEQWDEHSEEHQ